MGGMSHPLLFRSFASTMRAKVEISSGLSHSRPFYNKRAVLITRREGSVRSFANDTVVSALMQSIGWHVFIFATNNTLSVLNTCKLFYQASLVAGVSGAGLTNMVCSRPGTWMLEFHSVHFSFDYKHMAKLLQLQYHGLAHTFDDM